MKINRNEFRQSFQPSRIVLAIIEDRKNNRYNILPIAFNMYCSYNPLMFSIAIQNINYSYNLIKETDELVLSIPGEKIVEEVMFCGTNHGSEIDKFKKTNLTKNISNIIKTPGIKESIINIECSRKAYMITGDHLVVSCEVLHIEKNKDNNQKNILSISNNFTDNYKLLCSCGFHNLAIVK
jgi:flavin reductase (DIM6/NTAB) family NADH-FMN oxidoreductase RutF